MRGCRKQTFIPVVGRHRVAVEVAWKVACLSLLTCSLHPPLFSLPPHLEGGVCSPSAFQIISNVNTQLALLSAWALII